MDLELVEAAQAGDTRAFEQLMLRYKSRLTHYLLPLTRDGNDTDDIVQETLIKAYMGLHSFRGESSFSTWLFRIGINTAMNSLARRGRQLPRVSDPTTDEQGEIQQRFEGNADLETPEAKMETKQILDLLDAALEKLPPEQRTSFEMRELEGLSYEEIAEQMHCPVGTVRSRIHRARDTLNAALKSR